MISPFVPNQEVYKRDGKCVKKTHPRMPFTSQEDELLSKLVKTYGTNNWQSISTQIPGRNARQCRDRWLNYLSPDVVNGPWTAEEEELLVEKYKEFGPSWKQIATFFPTRTDINIKSRWNLRERRIKKESIQMNKALFCKKIESIPYFTFSNHIQKPSTLYVPKMQYFPQFNVPNPMFQQTKQNNTQSIMPPPQISQPISNINSSQMSEKQPHDINSSPLPFFTEKSPIDEENDFELKSSDDIFDSATNDCMNFLLMNEENNFNENFIDPWF